MFELLVPPDMASCTSSTATRRPMTCRLRPGLMADAIQQLQDAGVEADVWKIEGLDRREDCQMIVAAARRGGRENVGCIVLGRGEDDQKVREWLVTASAVRGIHRLRGGPDLFWDPLVAWRAKRIDARRRGDRDRAPLSRVCRHLRGKARTTCATAYHYSETE